MPTSTNVKSKSRGERALAICNFSLSVVALVVAVYAAVGTEHSARAAQAQVLQQLRILYTTWLVQPNSPRSVPDDAPLSGLSRATQQQVVQYWTTIVPTEIRVLSQLDGLHSWSKYIKPLVVKSARRRYMADGLCLALSDGSTLGGADKVLLRALDEERVVLPCQNLANARRAPFM